MSLWLVRHAVTLAPPGLCYGRLDVEADPAHTLAAARALAAALPPDAALRCSPALRCRQLAAALAGLRSDLAPATTDDRLREMDFGSWEGQSWDSIGAQAMQAWMDDFANHAPGGGEAVQALLARVSLALRDPRDPGQVTVWITHAGVVRAARLLVKGVSRVASAQDWPRDEVPFGGWERLFSEPAAPPATPA